MISDIKFYLITHGFFSTFFNLGFWSLLLYRWGHSMYGRKIYKILLVWYLYIILRNILIILSKIELPPSCYLGKNLNLVHAYGLVMGNNIIIGDNCTIGPWVVLGHNGKFNEHPELGNNIYVGAHACILGAIKIGDRSLLGANTVITRDIPADSLVKNPAFISVRKKNNNEDTSDG